MKLIRVLRLLILCEVVLTFFIVASDFWLRGTLPPELQNYLKTADTDVSFVPALFLFYGFVLVIICMIVGWIGLWKLWAPGRIFYTCGWCAGIIYVGVMGPSVNTALTTVLNVIGNVVGGMILGLVYFSDLRFDFHPRT